MTRATAKCCPVPFIQDTSSYPGGAGRELFQNVQIPHTSRSPKFPVWNPTSGLTMTPNGERSGDGRWTDRRLDIRRPVSFYPYLAPRSLLRSPGYSPGYRPHVRPTPGAEMRSAPVRGRIAISGRRRIKAFKCGGRSVGRWTSVLPRHYGRSSSIDCRPLITGLGSRPAGLPSPHASWPSRLRSTVRARADANINRLGIWR